MASKILESNASIVVLLIILAVVSFLVLNIAFQSTMDRVEWQEETYRVQAGDSLWVIAEEYCPDEVDCREWIDAVKELNGMDSSTIHPGQTLTVLAVKEGRT